MLLEEQQENCSCQAFESILELKNKCTTKLSSKYNPKPQQNQKQKQHAPKPTNKATTIMPAAQIANEDTTMNDPLTGAMEIIPDKLYYAAYKTHPSSFSSQIKTINGKTPTKPIHFFSIDNELLYWNFFLDYGPLNLGQLYKFCHILNKKVSTTSSSSSSSSSNKKNGTNYDNKIICYYSNSTNNKRANALFLICAWQVLYLNRTPEESMYQYFKNRNQNKKKKNTTTFAPIEPFHDASPCMCTYDLNIIDCLYGLIKAMKYNFFNFNDNNFNVNEYEYYEQVENGDLNWIIQDKILAFAGPHNTRNLSKDGGYCTLTPNEYIPYFKKKNVDLVVRLNKKNYDENKFLNVGINHKEHYYLDGSIPTKRILLDVINSFETCSKKGVFAVHCKAGLGRTGTCIGAYIMKHYKFTASEVIGWMRICRPGCVIGPQQHYLEEIQDFMWHEGDIMRLKLGKQMISMSSSPTQQELQKQHQLHNKNINKPKEKKKSLSSKHSKKRISADGTTSTATTTSSSSSSSTSNKVLDSITKQLQFGSLSVSNNNKSTKESSTQGDVLLLRRQQQSFLG